MAKQISMKLQGFVRLGNRAVVGTCVPCLAIPVPARYSCAGSLSSRIGRLSVPKRSIGSHQYYSTSTTPSLPPPPPPPSTGEGSPTQNVQDFNRMSWNAIRVLAVAAAGLFGYFSWEKAGLEEARKKAQQGQSSGKPLIGGPFSLVDHNGIPVTDLNYRGKWMLIYFGYTFCPDVCPEELEKMAKAIDILAAKGVDDRVLAPIFISCDPKRDSVESIRDYLLDFHPKFIGLTGTHAQIKRVAKAFRLYFSAPPKAVDDDETDYLVDHSIFFYLVNPEGEYEVHFGRDMEAEGMAESILNAVRKRNA